MRLLWIPVLAIMAAGCSPSPEPEPAPPTPKPEPVVEAPVETTDEIPASLKKHPNKVNALETMQETTVSANGHTYKVWVADTDSLRAEGMMYLDKEDVPDDRGMLFVFAEERPDTASFWMQNTPLALDIIYLRKDGTVVNVGNGEPLSEEQVLPSGTYWYVLELKRGTAAEHGIRPGTRVTIPSGVKAKE